MQFNDQLDKRLLFLGLAPFSEQLPEDHSVYRVVCFLKIYQQVELALLWALYFVKESARMYGSGLIFFEAGLVDLRLDQVWRLRLDSLEDSFLLNL